jgi:ribosome-binding protein aMBF1 (putative translation factor)
VVDVGQEYDQDKFNTKKLDFTKDRRKKKIRKCGAVDEKGRLGSKSKKKKSPKRLLFSPTIVSNRETCVRMERRARGWGMGDDVKANGRSEPDVIRIIL